LDFAACCYDGPHYLKWNLFNTGHVDPATRGGLVSDLDGIFCPDIAAEDDDDSPRYLAAIHHALAIRRPNRRPVPVIVTVRLEKYRAASQSRLRRVGIRWQRLVLGPRETLAERHCGCPDNVVNFKFKAYLERGFNPFVESDRLLARRILQRTGKPVLCPQMGRVLTEIDQPEISTSGARSLD
jgi:hypothetical protein